MKKIKNLVTLENNHNQDITFYTKSKVTDMTSFIQSDKDWGVLTHYSEGYVNTKNAAKVAVAIEEAFNMPAYLATVIQEDISGALQLVMTLAVSREELPDHLLANSEVIFGFFEAPVEFTNAQWGTEMREQRVGLTGKTYYQGGV